MIKRPPIKQISKYWIWYSNIKLLRQDKDKIWFMCDGKEVEILKTQIIAQGENWIRIRNIEENKGDEDANTN